MSTNITLKRSSVQGKVPVVGDLALGEIALNTYDGKLFIKKNVDGTESIVDVTANTNLTLTSNSSTVSVNSDRGTDVTILAANATTAGVLTADAQTIAGSKTLTGTTTISSTAPRLDFFESGGSTGFNNTTLIRDADVFAVQTRDGGTFVSNDYRITTNASGALTHEWRIGNTERMRIAANGNVGIGNTTPVDKLSVSGAVTATSFNAVSGFIENSQALASNYTLVTGRNAMSTGPIEINSGVTITIQDGARWVVI
jgi:hypothetical protein